MRRDLTTLNRYRGSITLIRKLKAKIRGRIRKAMEFTAYRYTLEYKLELLNIIQADMRRICSQSDKRFHNKL